MATEAVAAATAAAVRVAATEEAAAATAGAAREEAATEAVATVAAAAATAVAVRAAAAMAAAAATVATAVTPAATGGTDCVGPPWLRPSYPSYLSIYSIVLPFRWILSYPCVSVR